MTLVHEACVAWRSRPEHRRLDGDTLWLGFQIQQYAEEVGEPDDGVIWLRDGEDLHGDPITVVEMLSWEFHSKPLVIGRALERLVRVGTIVRGENAYGFRPRACSGTDVKHATGQVSAAPVVVPVNSSMPERAEIENSAPKIALVDRADPESSSEDARRNSQIVAAVCIDQEDLHEDTVGERSRSGALKLPDRKASKTVRAPKEKSPGGRKPRSPKPNSPGAKRRRSKPKPDPKRRGCVIFGVSVEAEEAFDQAVVDNFNRITAEIRAEFGLPEAVLTDEIREAIRRRVLEDPAEREHPLFFVDTFLRSIAYRWLWGPTDGGPADLLWMLSTEGRLKLVRRYPPREEASPREQLPLDFDGPRAPLPLARDVLEQSRRNEEEARRYFAAREAAEAASPLTESQARFFAMTPLGATAERRAAA